MHAPQTVGRPLHLDPDFNEFIEVQPNSPIMLGKIEIGRLERGFANTFTYDTRSDMGLVVDYRGKHYLFQGLAKSEKLEANGYKYDPSLKNPLEGGVQVGDVSVRFDLLGLLRNLKTT